MKRLLKKISIGAALIICTTASVFIFSTTASSALNHFRVNIAKYTDSNIQKNSGLHRQVLILIQKSNNILPFRSPLTITRTQKEIGTSFPLLPTPSPSKKIIISNSRELTEALTSASSDQLIIIRPGTYKIESKRLRLNKNDGLGHYTIIQGDSPTTTLIELKSREGLLIDTPNWIIQNISFRGICDHDSNCDHAIHMAGDADNIIIQNNTFTNFNAHIKSNGFISRGKYERDFPDNIHIINNNFVNEWIRNTRLPVTPIDVVGGNNWMVAGNFIADFSKKLGNRTSYGAFLKGGGENGVFKNNFVACQWKVEHDSPLDIRVGLSLGGGGTEIKSCQSENCNFEHKNGKISKNTIVNCENDVALYLKNAPDSTISENYLLNTLGIDVRFENSTAYVSDNQLHGQIRARDGAKLIEENNRFIHLTNDI